MNLLYASPLVGLGSLRERSQEPAEIHPGCVSEYGSTFGVVLVEEWAKEGVEVVGGGGEIEPGRVEGGGDLGVEFWHTSDGSGVGDEGAAKNADWRRGHSYFD